MNIRMKTLLSLTFFIGMCLNVVSQDTITLYLDNDFVSTKIEDAKFIRKVVILNNHYFVTDSDINGKMVNYGEYGSVNPWIEDGLSIHYNEFGQKYSSGNYKNGEIIGNWIYYINYSIDTVNYDIDMNKFQTINCGKNQKITNNRKSRKFSQKYIDTITSFVLLNIHLPARTKSKVNKFTQVINFTLDVDGKIKCPEIVNFIDNDLTKEFLRLLLLYKSQDEFTNPLPLTISISSIDIENSVSVFTVVEEMPRFKYKGYDNTSECLFKFISDSLRLPSNGCSGRVFVNFVVEQDGSIKYIKVLKGINNCVGDTAEIVRLFKSMQWIPGKQRQKAVRVSYNTSINFKSAEHLLNPDLMYHHTNGYTIYHSSNVDVIPEFPGGMYELLAFVGKNLKYPQDAKDNNIQGKVLSSFIVEADGSITDIIIIQGLSESCNQEVIRVIQLLPNFIPGKKNGENVRTQYNLPFKFSK